MLPLYTLSLLTTLITASPLTPRCTPSTNFTLQAVSSNSTINDVFVSIDHTGLILNSTLPESLATTFFKNDTNHLFAYAPVIETFSNGSFVTNIELAAVCAYYDGSTSVGGSLCATQSEEFPVFLGNYNASDVAFPDPMGTLGFDIGAWTGKFLDYIYLIFNWLDAY